MDKLLYVTLFRDSFILSCCHLIAVAARNDSMPNYNACRFSGAGAIRAGKATFAYPWQNLKWKMAFHWRTSLVVTPLHHTASKCRFSGAQSAVHRQTLCKTLINCRRCASIAVAWVFFSSDQDYFQAE